MANINHRGVDCYRSFVSVFSSLLHSGLEVLIPFSVFVSMTTTYLLTTSPASPPGRPYPTVAAWATFLGISSAILATVQYAPQLFHTYHMKLVGALSIPMMMIQTPGGILMVTSIVLRPGTNWTSGISSLLTTGSV